MANLLITEIFFSETLATMSAFTPEILTLMATAFAIGSLHTLMGPDHYFPFIMMSQSGKWTLRKTVWVTGLCGIGHVMSSVILGFIGVAFSVAISRLEAFESFRGNIAAWLLMGFGLVYSVWGIRKAMRARTHAHTHNHGDSEHEHTHNHHDEHIHAHARRNAKGYTAWALFIVFIFGPCEPLIPILMYPAAKESWAGMIAVTAVFAVTTIATMLGVVLAARFGLSFLPWKRLEKYTPALAGISIFLCGGAIQFLGL